MGAPQVVDSAIMQCSFGMAPSSLGVLPVGRVTVEGRAAAAIIDAIPVVNIRPFGMCSSLANPTVAAATSAALGVLTPQPCMPATAGWIPGATGTLIGAAPALTSASTCQCAYGGIITILHPGTVTTTTG